MERRALSVSDTASTPPSTGGDKGEGDHPHKGGRLKNRKSPLPPLNKGGTPLPPGEGGAKRRVRDALKERLIPDTHL
jgi:hypothetical protein